MTLLLGYISNCLIILSFISYFLLILVGRRKKITDSDGFNITKDLLNEYNSINIILSKSYFTVYNIKRRVIKMAKSCYYGNTLSDISVSLIEAGISSVDDKKNVVINLFRSILPNLKLLYIFSLVAILINEQTYNISDAKVSIIFFVLFAVISYIVISIKGNGIWNVSNNLNKIKAINKENRIKILGFMNKINILDKLVFISLLMMIIRCVMIILGMQ